MSGMNCRDFEGSLIELARRGKLTAEERTSLALHLDACDDCRAALDRQMRLSSAARALASEAQRFTVPARVEQVVMRELGVTRRVERRRWIFGLAGGAIAASLILALWLAYRPAPKPVAVMVTTVPASIPTQPRVELAAAPVKQVAVKRHRKVVTPPAVQPEQPFIAIPYTLPPEPYERANVVRMQLPVAALIAAGVPTDLMDPSAQAQADVLFGQDGRARAVRLISVSDSN